MSLCSDDQPHTLVLKWYVLGWEGHMLSQQPGPVLPTAPDNTAAGSSHSDAVPGGSGSSSCGTETICATERKCPSAGVRWDPADLQCNRVPSLHFYLVVWLWRLLSDPHIVGSATAPAQWMRPIEWYMHRSVLSLLRTMLNLDLLISTFITEAASLHLTQQRHNPQHSSSGDPRRCSCCNRRLAGERDPASQDHVPGQCSAPAAGADLGMGHRLCKQHAATQAPADTDTNEHITGTGSSIVNTSCSNAAAAIQGSSSRTSMESTESAASTSEESASAREHTGGQHGSIRPSIDSTGSTSEGSSCTQEQEPQAPPAADLSQV
jgi:hypothetical protein